LERIWTDFTDYWTEFTDDWSEFTDIHLQIVVGAAAGIGGCCCGWCAVCMLVSLRGPRKRGTVRLTHSQAFTATYSIEKGEHGTDENDKKTRIVWAIDEEQLKNLFGGEIPTVIDEQAASREETMLPAGSEVVEGTWSSKVVVGGQVPTVNDEPAASREATMLPVSSDAVEGAWSSKVNDRMSLTSSKWGKDLSKPSREAIKQKFKSAYLDGAMVEYYSSTHCRWLKGQVSLDVARNKAGRYHLSYDVKLEGVSKPRRDVALDMIRLPVEEDEDVVVFLLCQGGVWTPGKVVKRQRGRKANFSYSVQLNDGQTLQVPPAQVRRTFPAGSSVEIWRPQRGWVPAVVMEDSSELHFPRPLSKWSPAPPREESLATPRSSASESPRALGQPQSPRRRSVKDQLPKSPRALQSMWMASNDWTKALHPWIMIPVREGREKDWTKAHYALIEEVPLYLIRWPSAALALTENEKRFFPCKRRDRI